MLSVENFYWILFENLLKPHDLDCWYYFPFGTKDQLHCGWKKWHPRNEHHALFYFDQEPMWTDDFGTEYDSKRDSWSQKLIRILANSEHSVFKKKICQQRGMLDWYFFYHGFAALDWFRDAQYIDLDHIPSKIFSSYNNNFQDLRAYRIGLTYRLMSRDLLSFGDVSFHGSHQDCLLQACDSRSHLSSFEKNLVQSYLPEQDSLPKILDRPVAYGELSACFGVNEYQLWQNSLVHLVNETVFYHAKLHLTEKIFKPIVALRPFLLAAAPGNLAYLRSYGFKTFDRWWDESYDQIQDPDARADRIVSIIEQLCAKTPAEIATMHQDMQPILHHNKNHFFGAFRKIIVDELVDNFAACFRIWNNGRIDGKDLPLRVKLDSVKSRLLA